MVGEPNQPDKELPLVGSLRGLVILIFTVMCLVVATVWRFYQPTPEAPSPRIEAAKRLKLNVPPLPEPAEAPPLPPPAPEIAAVKTVPASNPAASLQPLVVPVPEPPLPAPEAAPVAPAPGRPANLFDTPGPRILATNFGITGKITLKGTPPPPANVGVVDPQCTKLRTAPPVLRFYVVGANNGLADVFVQIKGVSQPPLTAAPPVLLDQRACEYLPYIFVAQTGQAIHVRNSDPMLHNVHTTPIMAGNKEQNKAQMPRSADLSFTFDQPEAFLRFKCDVHPWMIAYVCVADSPYFGLSDTNGYYYLPKLPPGYYVIEASHRKSGTQTRTMRILPNQVAVEDFTFEVK